MTYYNTNAKEFFKSTINIDMTLLYNEFEKYLNPNDKILDLGCGSGRDSLYFINKGYKVTAIDNSFELAKIASEYINQNVICLNMLDLNFTNEFNAIWACASILHINKSEILNVFNKCFNALKKNGIFYSSFKYGDKEEEIEGRFFNFYTESSIESLINKTSFCVEKIFVTNDSRKGREGEQWLNVILKK